MSDEIYFDGSRYVSATQAARETNLTRDYIARLCREGKILGKRVGKNWYAQYNSLQSFAVTHTYDRSKRQEELQRERAREYRLRNGAGDIVPSDISRGSHPAPYAGVRPPELPRRFVNIPAQMSRAILSRTIETPGIADAAARALAHSSWASPAVEFLHKAVALTLALSLTFGTYSLVDPSYARSALSTAQRVAASIENGDLQNLASGARSQIAAVSQDPAGTLSNAGSFFQNIARSFHRGVNEFVYGIAFPPSLTDPHSGAVAVNVSSYVPKKEIESPPPPVQAAPAQIIVRDSPRQTVINNPIIERVIEKERIVSVGGISEEVLSRRIEQLDNKLTSKMYELSAAQSTVVVQNYGVTAQTSAVNQLNNSSITGASIRDSSFTGGSIETNRVRATDASFSTLVVGGDTVMTGGITLGGSLSLSSTTTSITAGNATITHSTSTDLYSSLLTAGNATSTNLFSTNLLATNATTTNVFATYSSTSQATSTSLYATIGHFVSGIIDSLSAAVAVITDLTATNLVATNATTTNATTTYLYVSQNATITNATTTNLFASTASSTNLYSTSASLGALSAGSAAIAGALSFSAAGAGITFTGTGNHDITASAGTLRIGSNTIIGNIEALDDTVDIGTPATRFDKFYANEVNATTLVGTISGGNVSAETMSINSDNATADAENSYLSFERGSVSPNALLSWNSSQDRFEFNQPLYIENASGGTATTTLALKAVANQTANIFTIASSSGDLLASFSPAGLGTFTGFLSTASSSITSGLFTASGGASTTNLTASGTSWLTGFLSTASTTISSGLFTASGGASTTNLTASGTAYLTGITSTGDTTLGNATTTTLYSTTASSTNLYSTSASFGVLSAGSAAIAGTLSLAGLATFTTGFISNASSTFVSTSQFNGLGTFATGFVSQASSTIVGAGTITGAATLGSTLGVSGLSTLSGFLSTASSTITSGLFTMSGGASTTNFTASGTGWFGTASSTSLIVSGTPTFQALSGLLASNGTGGTAARTLTGTANQITVANGDGTGGNPTLSLPSLVSLTAASSTQLSVFNNAWFGGTATSSFSSAGALTLITPLLVPSGGTGQNTFTSGQLLYGAGTGALQTVATSSLAFSGPLTGASSLGALVGGSNSTVTWTGLATTSQPSSSNLLVSNGGAGVYGVATSTLTATGLLSVSNSPSIIGSSGAVLTLPVTKGYFVVGDDAGVAQATSTIFVSSTGNLGIGTTTPNWKLQVAGTRPSLALSDTSAALDNKHWLFSSMGGNLYIGTSTDAYGTSTPAALTISNAGNATFSGTVTAASFSFTSPLAVNLGGTGATTLTGLLQGNGTGAITGITGTAGQFPYYNGVSTLLATSTIFLATSGNVGIGTTGPTRRLEVGSGAGDIKTAIGQSLITLSANSGNLGYVNEVGFGGSATTNVQAAIGSIVTDATAASNAAIYFATRSVTTDTAPTERMRITSTGNVGIGTTTPQSLLGWSKVLALENSATDVALTLHQRGTSQESNVGTNGAGLYLDVVGHTTATNNNIIFRTTSVNSSYTGVEAMRITSAGNVGIGTTTPQTQFVLDSATTDTILTVNSQVAGGDALISFDNTGDGDQQYRMGRHDDGIFRLARAGGTKFSLDTSDQFYFNGNVGIGTTTPASALHVGGTTAVTWAGAGTSSGLVTIGTQGTAGGSLFVNTASVNSTYASGLAIDGTHGVVEDTSVINIRALGIKFGTYKSNLAFSTTVGTVETEAMRILSNGNVGIGTTSPASKLHIQSAGSNMITMDDTAAPVNQGLEFRESGVTKGYIIRQDSNKLSFYVGDGSTRDLVILDGGNVGIGTTTPMGKFTVAGLSNALASSVLLSGSTYTPLVIQSDNTNSNNRNWAIVNNWNAWGNLEIYNSDAANGDPLSAGTSRFTIDKSGLVGIGTTTPLSGLQVVAAINGSPTTVGAHLGRVSNFAQLQLFDTAGGIIDFSDAAGEDADFRIIEQSGRLDIGAGTSPTGMTILSTGLVGIGKTDPGAILDVAGSNATALDALNLRNTNTTSGALTQISFYSYLNTTSVRGSIIGAVGTNDGGQGGTSALVFKTTANMWSVAPAERMRIDPSGNVGIGTSTPQALLHVQGTVCLDIDANFACTDNTSAISDARLKTNVTDIADGLSLVGQLRPVRFNWTGEYNTGTAGSLGFLAQEVEAVLPELVITDTAGYKNLDYGKLTAVLAGAVQELNAKVDARTSWFASAATSTVLSVDVAGRVGIGTSTPNHTLDVAGDIAAIAFVNTSTRGSKKDIAEVATTTEESILEQIAVTNLYSYRYKDESPENPLRLGLITDTAPTEVLSVSGDGVDVYKLATFTLAGVKAQGRKIDVLAARVDALEAALAAQSNIGSYDLPTFAAKIVEALKQFGVEIAQDVMKVSKLVAESFTVGSSAKPSGITLYDEDTGEPYCVKVKGGQMVNVAGECPSTSSGQAGAVAAATVSSEQSTVDSQQPTADSAGADTAAPVITLFGNNPATIDVGAAYGDLGGTVTDNVNDNLGLQASLDGGATTTPEQITLDTSAAGAHTILFSATDQAGNVGYATRTVEIVNPFAASADSSGEPTAASATVSDASGATTTAAATTE